MEKLKQDDIINIEVIDYGMDGEGIARLENYTIFVPFVAVGEKAKVKVTYVKKNLVFAKLVEIIEKSDKRTNYECNRFMKCGGCDLLHLKYDEQLKIKRQNLINLLKKNAGLEIEVENVIKSPKQLGYRNKIQLPFGTVNNKVAVGFYRKNTHKIVSITKCFLHENWVEKLIKIFLDFANKHNLTAYSDETKKGLLRHLVARYIDNKICIVLVINGTKLPFIKKLVKILQDEYNDNFSFYLSFHKEINNVIMGKTIVPIVDNKFDIDILGIKLNVNPFSFLQLNNEVRDLIYKKVIDSIISKNTDKKKIVIDAYAGVGLMGAVLAKNGAYVYNIEIVKDAIIDANKLYKENNIFDKVTNICGDATIELPKLIDKLSKKEKVWNKAFSIKQTNIKNASNIDRQTNAEINVNEIKATIEKQANKENQLNNENQINNEIQASNKNQRKGNQTISLGNPNTSILDKSELNIILDPPRKGCSESVIKALNKITKEHNLYYISCNPATLTRDLNKLKETYQIISITPFDMFPQTKHLETLVYLNKKP